MALLRRGVVGFAAEPSQRPSMHDRRSLLTLSTPLHKACMEGNVDEIRAILRTGTFDINGTDDEGSTPLHVAVRAKQADVVRFLMKKGVHLEIKDSSNKSPLEIALGKGFEIVRDILFGGGEEGLKMHTLPALLRARHENDDPDFFELQARHSPIYKASGIQSHQFSGTNHGLLPRRGWKQEGWDLRSIYLLKYAFTYLPCFYFIALSITPGIPYPYLP